MLRSVELFRIWLAAWLGVAGLAHAQPADTEVATQPSAAPVAPVQAAPESPPVAKVSGRVMAGWELERLRPEADQVAERALAARFFVRQVRLKLKVRLHERVRVTLSANVSKNPLRTAALNVRALDTLRFKLGRFKRPYSRLELTSIGKLPLRDRGLFNEWLIENAEWGDRAVGIMAWGKLRRADERTWLVWYLSGMNPAPAGSGIAGVDLHGRLELRPVKGLALGAGGARKWTERYRGGPGVQLWAMGADATWRRAGLTVLLEVDAAQNPLPPPIAQQVGPRDPYALGVVGHVSLDVPLGRSVTLQPTLAGEWVDSDLEFSGDETLRAVAGLHVLWSGALRVMPQVEVVRPLSAGVTALRSQVPRETFWVLVSGAFGYEVRP